MIRVRDLLHDQSVEGHKLEFEEQTQAADRVIHKLYIDGFFLGIVGIICLIVLFTELS